MASANWVFGYGSLMWKPGFRYGERRHALLRGLHRRLCIYSHVHRGTPERPGLVLGLDHGGSCRGIAFKVATSDWQATVEYLRAREQVTMVYLETVRTVRLLEGGLRTREDQPVKALTYIVNRAHPQYAGHLTINEQIAYIRQGAGQGGKCLDYVTATLDHLAELELEDRPMRTLAEKVVAETAQAASTVTS